MARHRFPAAARGGDHIDDPAQRVRLLPHASNAVYAAGRLLFARNGDLCAQSFDPDRLELSGPVAILARDVRFDRRYSLGVFSAAPGVLALQHGAGQDENELAWFDRAGQRIELVHGAANHDGINLSPDGSQAVVSFFDPATSRSHLEVFDLARKSSTRLTFNDADDYGALWSPDGTRVLFARIGEQGVGLWVKPADGSAAERPLRPPSREEILYPLAWSPDGSQILLTSLPGGSLPTGYWLLPASGEGALTRYTDSRSNGDIGLFSPDGRWVVFDANEGKGERTYLAPLPRHGRPVAGRRGLGLLQPLDARRARDHLPHLRLGPPDLAAAGPGGVGAARRRAAAALPAASGEPLGRQFRRLRGWRAHPRRGPGAGRPPDAVHADPQLGRPAGGGTVNGLSGRRPGRVLPSWLP